MFEIVQEIVFSVTGIRNLTMDTDFVRDLALNSFDIVNLIGAFEQRFSIEIPVRDIWNLNQVKDILAYMGQRGITA